jgi:hypothetical protein
MNNKPYYMYLFIRVLQFAAIELKALLTRLPLDLNVNSMSSVSWNG